MTVPDPAAQETSEAAREPDPGIRAALRELPTPARLLLAGVALNRMGSYVQVFVVLYVTHLGHTAGQAGLVLTGYGAGSVLGTLLGGTLAERLGNRRTIAGSVIATGLLTAALPAAPGYWALLLTVAAIGAASQVYRPAAAALLAELLPAHRLVVASAAFRLALNVGAALGPLAGAALLTGSYTLMFEVNAVVSVLFGLVALVVLPGGGGAPKAARGSTGARYADVLRDRAFTLVVLALFLIALVESQYLTALPLDLRERGVPTAVYTALVALNGLLVIVGELPLTRYVQTWPMRVSIAGGIALIGCGIGLYGIHAGAALLVAATVVWTLGEMVAAPSTLAYPALTAPDGARGRYIAALSAGQSVGYAAGPALGALLFQAVGGAVWPVFAAVGLLAAAAARSGVRQPDALREAAPHAGSR
ncbi:MFS transporter [Streptomyces kanamyceticus]|uniref:MFS transporter n=1 Tax=Streptomyces kanamyceticus TaxID=1967 RepID=A0A5J6G431_STRKN|nr:MFS transporter [Streptomyces kanamyceticus]QEU90389.1 MFS transporter [Streptomyces kanamyceticus]